MKEGRPLSSAMLNSRVKEVAPVVLRLLEDEPENERTANDGDGHCGAQGGGEPFEKLLSEQVPAHFFPSIRQLLYGIHAIPPRVAAILACRAATKFCCTFSALGPQTVT